MGRLIAIFASASISVALMFSNSPIFDTIRNMRESRIESSTTKDGTKLRHPSNIQAAVDRANADAQRKIQEVRDHVNAQLSQSTRTLEGINGANRNAGSNRRGSSKTKSGQVTSNPYLD